MPELLFLAVAVIGLIVMLARLYSRVGLLEREIGALRSFVLSTPPAATSSAPPAAVQPAAPVPATSPLLDEPRPAAPEAAPLPAAAFEPVAAAAEPPVEAFAPPPEPQPAPPPKNPVPPRAAAAPPRRSDLETALGTRWAVWVGGIALALGGIFLIRYTIEQGFFGPRVRLLLAGLLGLALAGAGEFIRRTGMKTPIEGAAGAYVPGILTAAGAFILFGTVYAAYGIYGFIGPTLAFVLLALTGLATLGAALIHGQALAGVGLLGAMVTPMLVATEAPNPWTLFGYLAIVLAANTAVARLRAWRPVSALGFAGVGGWLLMYLVASSSGSIPVVLFVAAVMLAALAVVWQGGWRDAVPVPPGLDWSAVAVSAFVGLAAFALMVALEFSASGGRAAGTAVLAAMVGVALWRRASLPLLHGAGVVAVLVHVRQALAGHFVMEFPGGALEIDGFPVFVASAPYATVSAVLLSALFLAAGGWSAHRFGADKPRRAVNWAAWGAIVPVAVAGLMWIAFGNLDVDYAYAAVTLALAILLAAAGEWVATAERPERAGGPSVSFFLAGAFAALILALHMGFGGLWTTMLVGATVALAAFATTRRSYPVLGWLGVAAVIVVMGRVAVDPTVVGAFALGRTPVLNALLPGYGVPALAFGFAAWQLARTTGGRPRLIMEAAAALFSLLAVAMLVRHAMHGGVIDSAVPTLAEQAIYTLLALGAGAILIGIDTRSPSPVLRIGSLAAGVVSAAAVVLQHFLVLNPLFTDESTGKIPVFNLLFLAYLLPALAAGALALYARGKRPYWYSAMLGVLAAALFFAYASLSLRRLFQGEFIALWSGMSQLETYAYSALWLAMGVALLILGVRLRSMVLRIASGLLIAVSVAKVFLFDMSELEGVLRALSFIGLGVVLIGIGLFYQRLLTRAAQEDQARTAVPAAAGE